MTLLDNFPHECIVRKQIFTQGSLGGRKPSYSNISTGTKCWAQPAGDSESNGFQKLGIMLTHKVYFRTNPNVTRRSQILITKKQGVTQSNPTPLDVVSIAQPDSTAGLGVCYRVLCREVTSEND